MEQEPNPKQNECNAEDIFAGILEQEPNSVQLHECNTEGIIFEGIFERGLNPMQHDCNTRVYLRVFWTDSQILGNMNSIQGIYMRVF